MERKNEMMTWLKKNFKESTEIKDKVPVDIVRGIFKQKFPQETNNTLGSVVRRAFQGVKRSRDGGGYYYSPLLLRCTTEEKVQNAQKLVRTDMCTQTLKLQESATKAEVISNVSQLQAAHIALQEKVTLLEKHVSLLEGKNNALEKCHLSLKRKFDEVQSENNNLKGVVTKRLCTSDFRGEGAKGLKTLKSMS